MTRIATLGSSVRLIVFQFLMKSAQVPTIIPLKRTSDAPLTPTHGYGVEVFKSTSRLDIFPLTLGVARGIKYELVDVWSKPSEKNWNMSVVRFVFCHREHVDRDSLFPEFVAKKGEFEEVLIDLVSKNLWATQGHVNPYFENGTDTGDQVLMLGCAGRLPNDLVFSGGRDENNRGIGPKIKISSLSPSLHLNLSNEVVVFPASPASPPSST